MSEVSGGTNASPSATQARSSQEELLQDIRNRLSSYDDASHILARQELLLQGIHNRLDVIGKTSELSKKELIVLEAIRDNIGSSAKKTTKTQFIWNSILQTVGLVIGILFGIFAILLYRTTEIANRQALVSNQLTLMTLCLSSVNSSTVDGPCAAISQKATESLSSLATAVFGPSATQTALPAPSSSGGLQQSDMIGISIGAIGIFTAFVGVWFTYKTYRQTFP